MTKKEMFVALLNLNDVKANQELATMVEKELHLLERRSNATRKPTKKQIENSILSDAILSEMEEGKAYTNKEMIANLPSCANLSSQKLNALLIKMVGNGTVERKVEKRVALFIKKNEGSAIE